MRDLCSLLWCAVVGLFRSRVMVQAEILVLRHQLNVLRRKSAKRAALGNIDRVILIGLYRLPPNMLQALKIITPETVIRWHRAGFRAYRALQITRIHGELLKLGIAVSQTTVDCDAHRASAVATRR